MKTGELKDRALDWAVAVAGGRWQNWICSEKRLGTAVMDVGLDEHGALHAWSESKDAYEPFSPSTDPSQAWSIIEREGINLRALRREGHPLDGQWLAAYDHGNTGTMVHWVKREDWKRHYLAGPTPLIAAMRCFVASRLGNTVDVPEELL